MTVLLHEKKVVPRLIVVEPDYLIDISTIANCFETYGHHPLLFTVNRLTPRLSNKHIVLGNFAGSALDDIINHPAGYDIKETFRSNFREKALDYATVPTLMQRLSNKMQNDRWRISRGLLTKSSKLSTVRKRILDLPLYANDWAYRVVST